MFENMTFEALMQRMLARVPNNIDKREGSIIWDAIAPVAIEFVEAYISLNAVVNESFADTQTREYLIRRVAERGLSPKKATKAILKGVFTPANLNLKMNVRFSCDALNYKVIEKIADGEYKLECETEGRIGNETFGKLIPIEYIDGLETATLTDVLIPAEDEEDTEALRQRYFDSFDKNAYGGNIADYVEKTNALDGVGCTKVTPVWNGGGTVLLTIIDSEYNPASDSLVKDVQDAIDPSQDATGLGIAPIGHIVTVQSAEAVPITITADFIFSDDYNFAGSKSQIEKAISDYLLEQRKLWADLDYLTVRVSQIEARVLNNVIGILDMMNTTINGAKGNLVLTKYQIPVFGGVSDE